MVPFQVSQHVPCVLPSILVSVDGTEPTVGPAGFVTAKEHPIYQRGRATIVFAGSLSGHLTNQRWLRYPARENRRQEGNVPCRRQGQLFATSCMSGEWAAGGRRVLR